MDAIAGIPTGWVVAACAAGVAALALHALARRRLPSVVFPGARFVRAGGSRKRMAARRLADVILAVVRAGAAAMLVLAAGAAPVGDGRAGDARPVVVALDCSASMGRARGQGSAFEEARARVMELIGEAERAGAQAAVVLAGAEARAPIPGLSRRYTALRRAVREVQATGERADGAGALRLAGEIASGSALGKVVVVSDFQEGQWPEPRLWEGDARIEGARRAEVVSGEAAGVVVEDVTLEPARPVEGEAVTARVRVRAVDGEGQRVIVEVDDGSRVRSAAVEAPAVGSAEAVFALGVAEAGVMEVEARLAGTGGTYETARRAAAVVRDARGVALLTGVGAGAGAGDVHRGAVYVAMALEAAGAPARAMVERIERVEKAGAAALVVVNAPEMDGAMIAAVAARLRDGLGVVWVVDSAASRRDLGALLRELGVVDGAPPRRGFAAAVGLVAAGDAALGAVGDASEAAHGALRGMRFGEAWALPEMEGARVHVAAQGGAPLLVTLGGAPLTVCAVSLDPEDSALVESALFPALAHALATHADVGSAHEQRVGEGLDVFIGRAGAAPYGVDGEVVDFETDASGTTLGLGPAAEAGARIVRDAEGSAVAAVAVNVAREELAPGRAERGSEAGDLAPADGERGGGDGRGMLLLCALGLLALEPALRMACGEGR